MLAIMPRDAFSHGTVHNFQTITNENKISKNLLKVK